MEYRLSRPKKELLIALRDVGPLRIYVAQGEMFPRGGKYSKTRAGEIIREMEDHKLVYREIVSRGATLVHLTEDGKKLAEGIEERRIPVVGGFE